MQVRNYTSDISENSLPDNDLMGHLHLNFTETDDAITIEAELPGYKPDDVDVSFDNQSLIIETREREVQSKSYYLGEYSQPGCRWIIAMKCRVRENTIKTRFVHNVLNISVSKRMPVSESPAIELA